MPRSRLLDPMHLSKSANWPARARQAELVAQFQRKIRYLKRSYAIEKFAKLDRSSFNQLLGTAEIAVARSAPHKVAKAD